MSADKLRVTLREALPRAINFRVPFALPVTSSTWDTITEELMTAFADSSLEAELKEWAAAFDLVMEPTAASILDQEAHDRYMASSLRLRQRIGEQE